MISGSFCLRLVFGDYCGATALALLDYDTSGEWQAAAMRRLMRSCEELIGTRGFEGWDN